MINLAGRNKLCHVVSFQEAGGVVSFQLGVLLINLAGRNKFCHVVSGCCQFPAGGLIDTWQVGISQWVLPVSSWGSN